MSVPLESAKALAEFPAALRALVEAELAAGNSIAEFSGGFPAPPAGNSLKLANKVSTRPRASGEGLVFYERNSSLYSGEFTDAQRFYFVLEPPNPPPPEPDMNAIRKAHEPRLDSLTRLAERRAGTGAASALGELSTSDITQPQGTERSNASRSLIRTETATGWTRVLSFEDTRAPHEVQFALERELMTLFTPAMADGRLCWRAQATVVGGRYAFELRFVASLFFANCYSLRVETSWAEQAAVNHAYYRNTSASWFAAWTRELMAANPPDPDAGSPERYRKLAEAALQAEAHLDSVTAIQQAIVAGMKRGASFGTSHKEGGTRIFWRTDRFIRSDYGDYPDQKELKDEAEFLRLLRQFCHWDVSRNAGQHTLSEFDAWKLILRRMRPG